MSIFQKLFICLHQMTRFVLSQSYLAIVNLKRTFTLPFRFIFSSYYHPQTKKVSVYGGGKDFLPGGSASWDILHSGSLHVGSLCIWGICIQGDLLLGDLCTLGGLHRRGGLNPGRWANPHRQN